MRELRCLARRDMLEGGFVKAAVLIRLMGEAAVIYRASVTAQVGTERRAVRARTGRKIPLVILKRSSRARAGWGEGRLISGCAALPGLCVSGLGMMSQTVSRAPPTRLGAPVG